MQRIEAAPEVKNMTWLNSSRIRPFFLNEKNSRYEVTGVKISRFVNRSNMNKPGLDLARIRLKKFRKLFREFTVIEI